MSPEHEKGVGYFCYITFVFVLLYTGTVISKSIISIFKLFNQTYYYPFNVIKEIKSLQLFFFPVKKKCEKRPCYCVARG